MKFLCFHPLVLLSFAILVNISLASEDASQQAVTYYLRRTWPQGDLKSAASFPLGYGIGDYGGFLHKGGLGSLGSYGSYGGGLYGGYGGHGGYGGFGGLKSGLGYSSGHSTGGAQNQVSGYENGAGRKGETAVQNSQQYGGSEDAQKQNQQSSGFYGNGAGTKNKYEKGGAYEGGSNFGQAGKNQGEVKNNQEHKKGHSTKGYQNFHHKDESSQSTTFFDEANDEGDHYDFKGQQGMFGDQGGSSFKGALQDGSFASDSKGKSGHYDSGFATDNQHGAKGSQNSQQYYGDNADYNQKKGFDDYGKQAALEHSQNFGGYKGQQYGGFKKGGKHFGGYGGGIGGHFGYLGY